MYLRQAALPFFRIETSADITVLARRFENLRFPGVEVADAAVDTKDGTCYFRCLEEHENGQSSFPENEQSSFSLLSFTYNWKTLRFQDPLGVYPLLREIRTKKDFPNRNFYPIEPVNVFPMELPKISRSGNDRYKLIMNAALLLARYGFEAQINEALSESSTGAPPGPEMIRVFLCSLLVSPNPELGMELLKNTGFLSELWPELACFNEVDQSKEFHPEGNVWNHTLETFRYRKADASGAFDLRLSLALLLHDIGKPISASFGNHRFDGHAEIGARAAARFLERLEFEPSLINDIFYLVKNHMLPAALKRLPLTKTAEIMASPLFPTLLELYRCDESSSFKGLDCYHENTAAYQAYLKNLKNPYRSADGKKMGKRAMYR
jgi:poly(A) polymerase